MNILLFLNKDIEANVAYNLLKEELGKHKVRIYYSENVGKQSSKPEELLNVEYYEKAFIYDELIPRLKRHQIQTDFEFFDDDFNAFEITKCNNPNTPEFIKEIAAFEPDLFISIRFAKIFREKIIQIPKKGILNLHSAILPDYRGIMGTLHNLKANKTEYGCTLHYISSRGIDTGEIIGIARKEIDTSKSLLWHILTLYPMGANMILESIQKLNLIQELPAIQQNQTEGNYYSVPQKQDFEELTALGFEIFNVKEYVQFLGEFVSPVIDVEFLS